MRAAGLAALATLVVASAIAALVLFVFCSVSPDSVGCGHNAPLTFALLVSLCLLAGAVAFVMQRSMRKPL